ncbi:TPA: HigA family addiction module antidote protein [Vibrio cholerae]|jgi:addiction module HigA family antidote|uniref:Antitoxin HigA-1 n=38 Tax=Pseudomonadota TaxID=1224 RepID=HIGA1_VIBCH|nr:MULTISPECIES: HigA family addiction module antitoxin [Vibrio]Q9KMG4.1 RecName: Full=Antitoxin HigA-1 [Vibrio cholerae O1 biovar El Tor str. N16961]EAZ74557.1 antidote protein, putative [Vibrio cholerae NCTC 8457]EEY49394.1 HigA protein (antitoxin to HigB) [Vibrio cholerae INDRE 91/1]EEY50040.1 HigA protein (antitoxin to HigB) [Vibrio cholerae CT 5369-93]EGR2919184.1 transcriptional regulator [Vibrio parahaemolyticus]EYC46434.1 XRE family transcriptional regulator [Vibrio cholerae O1 biovar
MRKTKRRPVSVGEMLKVEFLEPMGITSKALAEAMGVHRNTVSNLINGGVLTAPVAIKLAAALGNTPEFWLNIQHAVDLWDTRNRYQEEAKFVKPLFVSLEQSART